MQGQVLLNLAALCLWYSSYPSVGLLEYKSVVTFQEEQSESVHNGRTLGKSVDKLNLRVSVSGSQMKNVNRPGDSVFVTFLLLIRHGHLFIGRFRHHAG